MATEKRLIDANECYELADHCYSSFYHHVADLPILRNLLNNCPTVDAVEVVRCKDCWKSDDGLCSYHFKNVPGKDFCGDGERRTDEH